MPILIPHWVVNSDRLSPEEDRFREDYYYESPPTSPRNAGIDPSTTNMKQWYQKHNRVSDQKVPTGTNRASYHARETIKDDDERLAMRKGDLPPPVRERVANPRIREDRAVQEFRLNSEKMHRAAPEDAYTKSMV